MTAGRDALRNPHTRLQLGVRVLKALEQIPQARANLPKRRFCQRARPTRGVEASASGFHCFAEEPPGDLCPQQFLKCEGDDILTLAAQRKVVRRAAGMERFFTLPELAGRACL